MALATMEEAVEPRSYDEAVKSPAAPEWRRAMEKELEAAV
jgi:hypothetical protein